MCQPAGDDRPLRDRVDTAPPVQVGGPRRGTRRVLVTVEVDDGGRPVSEVDGPRRVTEVDGR